MPIFLSALTFFSFSHFNELLVNLLFTVSLKQSVDGSEKVPFFSSFSTSVQDISVSVFLKTSHLDLHSVVN